MKFEIKNINKKRYIIFSGKEYIVAKDLKSGLWLNYDLIISKLEKILFKK